MYSRLHINTILAVSIVLSLSSGCGAKVKSASDVQGIFQNSLELTDKLKEVCQYVNENSSKEPNLNDITLKNDLCVSYDLVGSASQNLSELSEGALVGFAKQDKKEISDDYLKIMTRTQVWTGKTIIPLFEALASKLKKQNESLEASSKKQKFTAKVIGDIKFDTDKWELSLEAEMISTVAQNGQVDIKNNWLVAGKRVNNTLVVTVKSKKDVTNSKTSIVHSGKIILVVIPHASDIYIDVITDLKLHSYGVNAAMEQAFYRTISEVISSIPEFIDE